MRAHPSEPFGSTDPRHGVYVADGYGVKIRVDHGHLVIDDGVGRHRRTARFNRATNQLRRLLILGHTGYISLEAIRWMWDLDIAVIHIDRDGQLLASSTKRAVSTNRLRRVQALAAYTAIGLEAARFLLTEKLRGQAAVLRVHSEGHRALPSIGESLAAITTSQTIAELLDAEAIAARAYWRAWAGIPMQFAHDDRDQVPEHWRTFGQRKSPISNQRRHAANPANALLNYLYTLLEAETVLALYAGALDPGLGIWHADEPGRDSLALDVMEAGRPTVDRLLRDLLTTTTFRRHDFTETSRGTCRIVPPLTHRLAEVMPSLSAAIEPVVIDIGRQFDRTITTASANGLTVTRPRRAEHRRAPSHARQPATPTLAACRTCGELLSGSTPDIYCPACAPSRAPTAAQAVAQSRARVTQPRRDKLSARTTAAAQWDRTHPDRPDPREFTRSILPGLDGISYSALSRATGLSRRYCKMIATGESVPHPMHWQAFTSISLTEHHPTQDWSLGTSEPRS